ncbi:MAG: 2-dehydropantoate 2-reductase [Chloroflexi bacterium]|nr:2-dehydropantoate 2-reductase [Chloroflexota bacterium]MDA1271465.1 2-dehydropantoate 2-reductase [Chloroflexota bacterium]PKB58627.1 MAG: 2-dehydropantoate 2-reductase [SAR202 cluster bacterium Casp-Chloro-G2]
MRIAIFGAGGIGGYLGGRLSQAGEEVVLIARGEHLEAIREHGLRVDSIKGDFVAVPALATNNPTEAGTVDVVILGVKAWQVNDAAKAMRPMIGPHTFVVPMQNGVEAPDQLAAVLGKQAVVVGLGGLISYIVGPGHILHAGGEPFVAFGETDDSTTERTQQLLRAFQNADVRASVPSNIHAALWGKLAFMAANSGIGAITRVPSGQWRSVPESWEMAQQVVREVVAVAQGRGIQMPNDAVAAAIARLEASPPDGTSSMQRDLMEGRPSELEVQSGGVVRLGKEAGVPTPVNTFIYHSLLPQEMKARGKFGPEE